MFIVRAPQGMGLAMTIRYADVGHDVPPWTDNGGD